MQSKSSFIILGTFLLLLIAKGTQSDLVCYVCDNCAVVTADTPMEPCDADYFNTPGTELPSTMATTEDTSLVTEDDLTITTDTTTESSTTTEITTETTPSESTEPETTAAPHETGSTEPAVPMPPTPPTVGPPQTTTGLPTPPVENIMQSVTMIPMPELQNMPENKNMSENNTQLDNSSLLNKTSENMQIAVETTTASSEEISTITTPRAYRNSSMFRQRQRRSAPSSSIPEITYHCFTVQEIVNHTLIQTKRGCSSVTTMESVCGQQEQNAKNNNMTLGKCHYCSSNKCNGSTALNASLATIIVALVAALLKHV